MWHALPWQLDSVCGRRSSPQPTSTAMRSSRAKSMMNASSRFVTVGCRFLVSRDSVYVNASNLFGLHVKSVGRVFIPCLDSSAAITNYHYWLSLVIVGSVNSLRYSGGNFDIYAVCVCQSVINEPNVGRVSLEFMCFFIQKLKGCLAKKLMRSKMNTMPHKKAKESKQGQSASRSACAGVQTLLLQVKRCSSLQHKR